MPTIYLSSKKYFSNFFFNGLPYDIASRCFSKYYTVLVLKALKRTWWICFRTLVYHFLSYHIKYDCNHPYVLLLLVDLRIISCKNVKYSTVFEWYFRGANVISWLLSLLVEINTAPCQGSKWTNQSREVHFVERQYSTVDIPLEVAELSASHFWDAFTFS